MLFVSDIEVIMQKASRDLKLCSCLFGRPGEVVNSRGERTKWSVILRMIAGDSLQLQLLVVLGIRYLGQASYVNTLALCNSNTLGKLVRCPLI